MRPASSGALGRWQSSPSLAIVDSDSVKSPQPSGRAWGPVSVSTFLWLAVAVPMLLFGETAAMTLAMDDKTQRLEQVMLVDQAGGIGSGVIVAAEEECPRGCLCKWAGGKQTAECGSAQLTEVPEGLNRDTQVRGKGGRKGGREDTL